MPWEPFHSYLTAKMALSTTYTFVHETGGFPLVGPLSPFACLHFLICKLRMLLTHEEHLTQLLFNLRASAALRTLEQFNPRVTFEPIVKCPAAKWDGGKEKPFCGWVWTGMLIT